MKRFLYLTLLVATAGCSDGTTQPDGGVPETQLNFLRFSSSSVVTVKQASFWAVKGKSTRLLMRYADGSELLRFDVGGSSLLTSPNGRIYLDGDSVLITVNLDASNRVIARFEPSGLQFNPLSPAKLKINYAGADDDIDGDGDHDARDIALELQLKIWKQEQPGLPWLPQLSLRIDAKDIEGTILSFTGFAMAS